MVSSTLRAGGVGAGMEGEFQAWQPRVSRKAWRCDGECGVPILPGETYLEIRICDRGWHRVRLCTGCEREHQRQAVEWGEACYEVAEYAMECGLAFNAETKTWEAPDGD